MNTHLTEQERYKLEVYLKEKVPVTEIARKMNRCRQTIYNEIQRGTIELIDSNLKPYKQYCADVSQRKYEELEKNKGRPLKVGKDLQYIRYVEEKVKQHYSFYAVLHLPETKKQKTTLCERTLYNYYHDGIFLNLKPEDMPYKVKKKKKKFSKRGVALHNIKSRSIEERPKEVLDREEYGHWEMDTVVGGKKKSKKVLLVITERMTREEIIKKIPDKKMKSVVKALDRLERKMGKRRFRKKFKSITMDNGVEFLDWQGIEKGNRTITYYCHPFCSGERGSNENQNKLIRRFCPKGCDIADYSDAEIQYIEDFINTYPRRLFGGLSSRDFLIQKQLE